MYILVFVVGVLFGLWGEARHERFANAQPVPSTTEQGEFYGYIAPSPYNPNYAVESEAPSGNQAPCN